MDDGSIGILPLSLSEKTAILYRAVRAAIEPLEARQLLSGSRREDKYGVPGIPNGNTRGDDNLVDNYDLTYLAENWQAGVQGSGGSSLATELADLGLS